MASNPIQTPFKDAILPGMGMDGVNAADINGIKVRDGMEGTSRTMPETNLVDIKGASNPGRSGGSDIKGS